MLDQANVNNGSGTGGSVSALGVSGSTLEAVGGAGSTAGGSSVAKKLKTCNKNASVQRFWPESIANAIKIANKGEI